MEFEQIIQDFLVVREVFVIIQYDQQGQEDTIGVGMRVFWDYVGEEVRNIFQESSFLLKDYFNVYNRKFFVSIGMYQVKLYGYGGKRVFIFCSVIVKDILIFQLLLFNIVIKCQFSVKRQILLVWFIGNQFLRRVEIGF